jgi:hypothetical protein
MKHHLNQFGLGFEVWQEINFLGTPITINLASFYYWQECLDYLEYCKSRGARVTVRTLQTGLTYRAETRDYSKVTA